MHERAGVPDAPHHPITDGKQSETAVRPTNVIVTDEVVENTAADKGTSNTDVDPDDDVHPSGDTK